MPSTLKRGTLELDADHDGQISPDELMTDFKHIHFRADVMLERVTLEDGLLGFMQQTFGNLWKTGFQQRVTRETWYHISYTEHI